VGAQVKGQKVVEVGETAKLGFVLHHAREQRGDGVA
jgi:hypothetical protein